MDILLNSGEIICVDGDARNLAVSCKSGQIWLTQPGDSNDHLLAPGDQFIVSRKGRVAVMALKEARLGLNAETAAHRPTHSWQMRTA